MIAVLALKLFFQYKKRITDFEKKAEKTFSRLAGRKILLLDGLVIILSGAFILKTAAILYKAPIYCRNSDMLPLIRKAGEIFLSGGNPFAAVYCPWNLPFTYFPFMISSFFPGVLFRFDIRFISLLSCVLFVLLVYGEQRKSGRPLNGFLLFLVLITSGFLPFAMQTVQSFPFLLLLFIGCRSLLAEKYKTFFFSMALALATRRIFLVLAPVLIIYYLKNRKLKPGYIPVFLSGLGLGFLPALFFPVSFLTNQIDVLKHFDQLLKKGLYLTNSLGFSYYLHDLGMLASILQAGLVFGIYFLAFKYVDKKNLWFFLISAGVIFVFFSQWSRPEEYYFIPLVALLCLPGLDLRETSGGRFRLGRLSLLGTAVTLLVLAFYPFLPGGGFRIESVRRDIGRSDLGFESSNGYLELSFGANPVLEKKKGLRLDLRREHPNSNKPVRLRIRINEQECLTGVYSGRRIELVLGSGLLRKFSYIGSNYMELELEDSEPFKLRIFPVHLE